MKEDSPISVLEEARSRNAFLEPLLQTPNGIYFPRIDPRLVLFKKIAAVSFPKIKIHGRQNAEKAVDMIHSGEKLKVVSHHSSHADGAAIRRAAEQIGCGLLYDEGIFAAGIKMFEGGFTRYLVRAENLAVVVPPQQLAQTKEKRARLLTTSGLVFEEDVEEIDKYIKYANETNKRSGMFLEDQAAKGHPALVYPEATRSRHGYIDSVPREVSVFFRDGYILPVSLLGVSKKYPPNSFINLWQILNQSEIEIFFGAPFEAQEAWDIARRFFGRGKNSNPAEVVMAKVAQLTPQLVLPHKVDYYKDILLS